MIDKKWSLIGLICCMTFTPIIFAVTLFLTLANYNILYVIALSINLLAMIVIATCFIMKIKKRNSDISK